jgi:acetylornithine deacetylase/succinyl-diaminopimelate desuccinylase-like protein
MMGMWKRYLDVETLIIAASADDELAHAPNEFYRLHNFERIQRLYCRFLEEMGR